MTTYTIYTDASWDKDLGIAVCGFMINENGRNEEPKLFTVAGMKSSNYAEANAVELALQHLFNEGISHSHVCFYTDALTLLDHFVLNRYRKLVTDAAKQYIAHLQGNVVSFQFEYVKGHRPSKGDANKNNHIVDRLCRYRLRSERESYKRLAA